MTLQAFKFLGTVLIASALLACGSGGGTGDPVVPANPGMPITPVTPPSTNNALLISSPSLAVVTGQPSKNISLAGCIRLADSQPISSATLVIEASGDMIFSGSIQSAPVAQLARLNVADTNQRQLVVRADAISVRPEFLVFTASQRMDIGLIEMPRFVYSAPIVQIYKCEPGPSSTAFQIEQPLTNARVVSTIVNGSTGTVSLSPSGGTTADYTQTASIVSWDTGSTGTFARFASFNLDTAQLGQGTSLNASGHTPVAYTLPSSSSLARTQYTEYLNPNGNKQISFEYDNIKLCYTLRADNTRDFRFAKSPSALRCQF